MKVSIFGTGYVGLVTGVCLANLGHSVTCIDVDQKKIAQLNQGVVPIHEPGLAELIIKNKQRITFSTDPKFAVAKSAIVFIAVGTPQAKDGSAQLDYVKSAAKTIAEHTEEFTVVVIKSTVPVGTGDLVEKIIATKQDRQRFAVVSNPEFLKEGSAIEDFNTPDRIVIGTDNEVAIRVLKKLYKKLEAPTVVTDRRSSELIKYAANAFLATKISFINSIASIAEKTGADISAVAEGMGLDKRINRYFLRAGIGYGGSCFPKDVQALIYTAQSHGAESALLETVESVNYRQKQLAVQKLTDQLENLNKKKIALLGLSFKPNTDDLREAPSLTIIESLLAKNAQISAWDPISEPLCAKIYPDVHYCPSPYEALTDADGVIIVTEWQEVKELNLVKVKKLMKNPLVIDGRNILDQKEAKELGIQYFGIGR